MMASPDVPLRGAADDLYRQAMLASSIGTAILDLQGRWLELNPAFARLLGCNAADLVGHPSEHVLHPDDRERLNAQAAALLAGRPVEPFLQIRYLAGDGQAQHGEASLAVLRDAGDTPRGLLLHLREDAAGRHDAQALEAARQQLQLFADSVAHDLRAPLRSIESFSGLLAQRAADRLDAAEQGYLGRVRAAAARMGELLTALGELARATRAELRPATVDLSLLAEWVGAELHEADPQRTVELQVAPGLAAHGDERLFKLMLVQLLGNAWKFTRTCDAARVALEGERDGDRLRVHVRDNGTGFDPQYAHKLFQPFQRLHGAEHGGGHGLGLAIAQTIAQRHGGRISAQSQPGCGCVFTIELPAAAEGVHDA